MATKRTIAKIYDGDSGVFANGEEFRLLNVGAPEEGKKGYETAKRTLAGMLAQDKWVVTVKTDGSKDHYGRLLVELSNSGGSINQRMREKGFASRGR